MLKVRSNLRLTGKSFGNIDLILFWLVACSSLDRKIPIYNGDRIIKTNASHGFNAVGFTKVVTRIRFRYSELIQVAFTLYLQILNFVEISKRNYINSHNNKISRRKRGKERSYKREIIETWNHFVKLCLVFPHLACNVYNLSQDFMDIFLLCKFTLHASSIS